MHVWISEGVSGLSELKANNRNKSPPPASVEETKADSGVVSKAAGFYQLAAVTKTSALASLSHH